jgi:hypothetical protein
MIDLIKHLLKEQGEVVRTSNFDRILDKFREGFPNEYKNEIDTISDDVKSFIRENNYTIKFLNSCSTGFSGVRTDKAIIICSPLHMASVGDFLYTIFHEIRHEQQISIFKMGNPTIDSLDDFEELSEKYWEMELDADSFAKRKIAEIVMKSKMPVEIAKILFRLSHYVEDYPSLSKMVKFQITKIANQLKQMRDSGQEIKDISDHPFVKQHLDKLEEFI